MPAPRSSHYKCPLWHTAAHRQGKYFVIKWVSDSAAGFWCGVWDLCNVYECMERWRAAKSGGYSHLNPRNYKPRTAAPSHGRVCSMTAGCTVHPSPVPGSGARPGVQGSPPPSPVIDILLMCHSTPSSCLILLPSLTGKQHQDFMYLGSHSTTIMIL